MSYSLGETVAALDGADSSHGSGYSSPRSTPPPYSTPRAATDGGDDPAAPSGAASARAVEQRAGERGSVGSCLSGGLDSTTIVGFMSELLQETRPTPRLCAASSRPSAPCSTADPIDKRESSRDGGRRAPAPTPPTPTPTSPVHRRLRDLRLDQEDPSSADPARLRTVVRHALRARQVTVPAGRAQGERRAIAGYVPYQLRLSAAAARTRQATPCCATRPPPRATCSWPLAPPRLGRGASVPARRAGFFGRASSSRHRPRLRAFQDGPRARTSLQDLLTYSLPCLSLRGPQLDSVQHRGAGVPSSTRSSSTHVLGIAGGQRSCADGWSRWILRAARRARSPRGSSLRRWKVGFTTPAMRSIRHAARRPPACIGLADVPARPYSDGDTVVSAFRACCRGGVESPCSSGAPPTSSCWLRGFVDVSVVLGARRRGGTGRAGRRRPGAPRQHRRGRRRAGCRRCRRRPRARRAPPRPPRPSACWPDSRRTRRSTCSASPATPSSPACPCTPTSSAAATISTISCAARSRSTCGRATSSSWPRSPSPPARPQLRSRRDPPDARSPRSSARPSTKTPHGIGLGIPETMQLAIDEAGAPRIVAAAAVSAAGEVVGKRGLFYKVAGATWRPSTAPPGTRCRRTTPTPSWAPPTRTASRRTWRTCSAMPPAGASSSSSSTPTTSRRRCSAPRRAPTAPSPSASCATTRWGRATSTPVCVLRPLGPLPSQS